MPKRLVSAALACLAAACAPSGEPVESASVPFDPTLVATGEEAFFRCQGCHSVEQGAPSSAGPNLHGVIGRVAGTYRGYPFTDALATSGIVWDAESLDAYLANPTSYVPGSDMRRGTVRDAAERAAIIAFLASQSE